MPVRKVITRRSNHFRTYIPSIKHGRPTPCESMLEGAFIRLCELSPLVRSYEVQPSRETLRLAQGEQSYTPDVRVQFMDGTDGWFEIKPAARLAVARVAMRMEAAQHHFAKSGRQFRVITDKWLEEEPRAGNILEVMYHRRGVLTPVERDRFERELRAARPQNLADLCTVLGADDAWRLIGLGIVGLHLEEQITSTSTVYLEGGHRHANLLA